MCGVCLILQVFVLQCTAMTCSGVHCTATRPWGTANMYVVQALWDTCSHTYSFTKDSMLRGVGLFSWAALAALLHTRSMYFNSDTWYGEWSSLCSLPWRCAGVSSMASYLRACGAWGGVGHVYHHFVVCSEVCAVDLPGPIRVHLLDGLLHPLLGRFVPSIPRHVSSAGLGCGALRAIPRCIYHAARLIPVRNAKQWTCVLMCTRWA